MAEAEDVIVDAARHATSYAQALWRRHRPSEAGPATVRLADVAPRIELLLRSLFGTGYRIRIAQPPAPATFLARALVHRDLPRQTGAVPSTDGACVWLPADSGFKNFTEGTERMRLLALQQAMRASRGSANLLDRLPTPLLRDVYLVLEAQAADEDLARMLPGLLVPLNALRDAALRDRPDIERFAPRRIPLELHVRRVLQRPLQAMGNGAATSPEISLGLAIQIADKFGFDATGPRSPLGGHPLFRDMWTGCLTSPEPGWATDSAEAAAQAGSVPTTKVRGARLMRRPDVRLASEEEDDARQGAWMIQTSQPHEHAEDPFGMQRPTDRDEDGAADEYAESLADLEQARLVSTPKQAKEVFLSDDPPDVRRRPDARSTPAGPGFSYPEWDYRLAAYREPGATVHERLAPAGPRAWVEEAMAAHRSMLDTLRRRFEMLRARRTLLRRQLDGDEVDFEACVEANTDFRAGLPMSPALYQTHRRQQRDMAVLLLIDVSGSTDGWISAHRRVIDVEREALLLVCIALAELGQPYAVQAFSGYGPQGVMLHTLKRFDEAYGDDIALRISGLEPDQYTRAGAALRHASAVLMRQAAAHRLLLLLSDGKPNDIDAYDGRYGVEDTRQAVMEARLQGISPFCLTVDCYGSNYLPVVFGSQHYALLHRPELLPVVLLDWMRRLISA
jgi:nitric oxide reductase NorD protein